MTISEIKLVEILADGELHSGQALAQALGVSRTAIWKQLNKIREKNLEIMTVKGRGYQLVEPLELLDEAKILQQLDPEIRNQLTSLQLHYQVSSTNQVLMDRLLNQPVNGHVVLAEYQTEGRGRGNNKWLSGLGAGLYLSIGWHFDSLPKTFSALSLATGVILAQSVKQAGSTEIELKWPNDLVYQATKLGGILIESRGQHAGAIDVVIGIGLNINLTGKLPGQISQPSTDLASISQQRPSRNLLMGIIINNVFELLSTYADRGFDYYIDDWRKLDSCRGKQALLHLGGSSFKGTVIDIDEDGNILMLVDGKRVKYGSGELSLRLMN